MNVSPAANAVTAISNAVSAAILQESQAATTASVAALTAIAGGNQPATSPTPSTASTTSLLDLTV